MRELVGDGASTGALFVGDGHQPIANMSFKNAPPPGPPVLPQSTLSKLSFWIVLSSIIAFSMLWLFRPEEPTAKGGNVKTPAVHATVQ